MRYGIRGEPRSIIAVIAMLFVVSAPRADERDGHLSVSVPDDSIGAYGPWIFQTLTSLARCGDYRVLVVRMAGTDMLYLDRLSLISNNSMYEAVDGRSFSEFDDYEASNDIETVRCRVLRSGDILIVGRATSGHTNRAFHFRIALRPGEKSYRYWDDERQ
jgi:hypothetical protein